MNPFTLSHRPSPAPARAARRMPPLLLLAVLLLAVLLATGCADDLEGTPTLAIAGSYIDEYTTQHTITDSKWTQVSIYGTYIVWLQTFSNISMYAAGQVDASDAYFPNKFARNQWTHYNGSLYYCATAYDKDTLGQALSTSEDVSDPTAPASCGGFSPWTNLTP